MGTRPLARYSSLPRKSAPCAVLDGISYQRAGRRSASPDRGGDSMDLLLGPLTDLGFCQPDGTFITSWTTCASGLRDGRMRRGGVPGWAGHPGATTQSWANQKVLYDAKRHTHTAQGLALSTIHGDLLWSDGGWPDSCHEHELVALAGLEGCWTRSRWQARWIGGFGAWPRPASTGMRRSGTAAPSTGSPRGSGRQPPAGRAAGAGGAGDRPSGRCLVAAPLGATAAPRPGVFRAAGALVCLGRWLHRVPA
jgi:hypothetical protein